MAASYLLDTTAFSDLVLEKRQMLSRLTHFVPAGRVFICARMKREAERKGLALDDNDLWIAATAVAMDAVLITRDTDFRRLRALVVETWA